MAKYVMSSRRAGKFKETEKAMARAAVGLAISSFSSHINLTRDIEPDDPLARRIVKFDADPAEIQELSRNLDPDVILEPEIMHYKEVLTPFGYNTNQVGSPSLLQAGTGNTIKLKVVGANKPVKGAEVILNLSGAGGMSRTLKEVTNQHGRVSFSYSDFWTPSAAIAIPLAKFWTTVLFGPVNSSEIECPKLPKNGPLEWWHNTVGVNSHSKTRGKGIRVGVIDSGIGPHPYLSHATDLGAFVGTHDANAGADVGSHGTHVSGTIGAKPTKDGDYAGIAPGASLFSIRVFPNNEEGAPNDDIANAIDLLSKQHKVDLINLSLGSPISSSILEDAIQDAAERGTLCICAAGNSSGPVEFPGAFSEAVAVSALGQIGWPPPGTLASLRMPQLPSKFGDDNLFLANFSCFGDEIDCCAPGAGILATIPDKMSNKFSYGAMGGTSMASPIVCGTLAAILSKNPAYKAMPRDETRTEFARKLLRQSCRSVGLNSNLQGAGVPTAP